MNDTRPTAAPTTNSGTVADSIARTMNAYGIEFAFGIPGNDVLELVRAGEDAGVRFVLAKAEPSAAFMADAVYQVTGKPAALIAALGPGIANAISGVAGALMERTAMLVLSGEMATKQSGIYNHQVFDHVALAAPVTKYAATLNRQRAAQHVARALDIATAHPAGPVLLNVAADDGRAAMAQTPAFHPSTVLAADLSDGAANDATDLLKTARKPLALIGRGALRDGMRGPLQAFLEGWGMPFLATYKAKGIVDEHHPLSLGSVGLSPVVDTENHKALTDADLLVLIGFDPIELRDAWVDAWPHAKAVLTVDWTAETHRIFPLGRQAVGDVAAILKQLTPTAAKPAPNDAFHPLKAKVTEIVRARQPKKGISPAGLFHTVDKRIREDWIMTVDVGAHRILANHVLRCRSPGQLLQSNGLGCMGYAVPAAIGAKLARPAAPVIAMLGDGCMLMTQGELALAAELDLPLVVVVLNDAALALIKLKQSKMKMAARAVDFKSPRFDVIAEGFGAKGVRVETIGDFEKAFDEAIASNRLTVIDALCDPAEYWEQM